MKKLMLPGCSFGQRKDEWKGYIGQELLVYTYNTRILNSGLLVENMV